MYAHEVIEDLKTYKQDRRVAHYCEYLQNGIENAVKFNLPMREDLRKIFDNSEVIDRVPIFMGKFAKYIKLPYLNCYFDFCNPGKGRNDKVVLLVKDISQMAGAKSLEINVINYSNAIKRWLPSIFVYIATLGSPILSNTDTLNFLSDKIFTNSVDSLFSALLPNQTIVDIKNPFYSALPYISDDEEISFKRLDSDSFFILHHSLALLNCKNLKTIKVKPNKKINKKRIKRHKKPMFEYRILSIDNSVNENGGRSKNSNNHYRRHFCRGHFKEYTDEKPLFGKITGLVWWDAHLRGKNNNGYIYKDYRLKTN